VLDSMIAVMDPEMPRQIQRWGGNYTTWQNRVNTLKNWILARCSDEIIGGIEDCYDVEAQGLTVLIEGVGNVQISTVLLTPAQVPWQGTYFSPLNINIQAIETNSVFLTWEVVSGNIVIANPLALSTSMVMNSDGVIKAIFVTELTAEIAHTATSCHDSCDGTATISAVGGTAPYTYTWDGVSGDATIETLCPGSHTGVVTDSEGASIEFNFVIAAPQQVQINPIVNQISCNGLTDGSISVGSVGGTAPYFYTLDPLGTTNSTGSFNNLFEGGYDLTVQDDNGCTVSFSFEIIEPAAMQVSVTNITNLACGGACNGTVNLSVSGGTTPYNFLWNNNASLTGNNDLCAGNNFVVITDSQGCFVTSEMFIEEPAPLQIVIITDNATCIGMNDGSAIITAVGGTEPLTFDLGGLTSDDLNQLAFGIYPVTVTDAFNCSSSGEIVIGYDFVSDLSAVVFTTPVTCWNQQDGTATAVVSGGFEPVSVQWNDSRLQKTHTAVGLSEETYEAVITDNLGCNIAVQAVIEFNIGCFFIANVLTPNGDGSNDFWTIGGLEHFPNSSVVVFDRWGSKLFESRGGYNIPWDGKYNSNKLPAADYYYVITYDPAKEPITGTVTIKY
jgi:gliding motility-associated-like protein